MRVKQTARKSTATLQMEHRLRSGHDPVRRQIAILQTKRNSQTPTLQTKKISGRGKNLNNLVKVKPRARPGTNVLREIRRYQNSFEHLIPRAAFHRVVREITQELAIQRERELEVPVDFKYQAAALEALQDAAEAFLVRLMEDSYLLTLHSGRVTLFVKDIQLCRRIQREVTRY